jgi:ceramide glucosyltransferase
VTFSVAHVLEMFCAAYWIVATLVLAISVIATIVQPWLCARRGKRTNQPPVSIVLPLKLLEHGFDAAQESALLQDYPHFEVIAAAVDTQSDAARRMGEIFARFPQIETRILKSTAKFAKSPKVDNLYAPVMSALNDTIFMKDANSLLEPNELAEHMKQLCGDVGLVCAIPYMAGATNLAAHIEAGIINGPHARMLFLASALGHGFGVGKIMLFRRSDFLRAGGFDAIAHTVGEDNAMAKAMERIGLRTVFSHRAVRQDLGARDFVDVYNRQLRWSVIRREDELYSFLLEPICQALPAAIAAAAAAPLIGFSPAAGFLSAATLWFSLETALSFVKGWQVSWASPAIFFLREAVMLGVWLHAWTTSRVVWARDVLDAGASAPPPSAAPAAKKEG